jgi:hypothetical protein
LSAEKRITNMTADFYGHCPKIVLAAGDPAKRLEFIHASLTVMVDLPYTPATGNGTLSQPLKEYYFLRDARSLAIFL